MIDHSRIVRFFVGFFVFALFAVGSQALFPSKASAYSQNFSDSFDSLINGSINGQNGWTINGQTWTIGAGGTGTKIVTESGGAGSFNLNYISNGGSTWTNERLKADFTITNTAYSPQFWLRKTAATGDAGGYLVYYNAGTWYMVAYAAGNGGLSYTTLATSSTPAVSTGTWYTAIAEVSDDMNGNPVLNFSVYPQGGSVPGTPTMTYTDTAKTFLSGYFGLGANTTGLSYDNVTVDYDTTVTPKAVTNLSAYSGDGQVVLDWTAPGVNVGGGSITDYLIEYKESAAARWITVNDGVSTAVTTTITGLTNNGLYDFRVSAINAQGTAPSSNVATTRPLKQYFSDSFDSLTNGSINGQNGWTVGSQTWTVGAGGSGTKIVTESGSGGTFNLNYISNGGSTWTNERLKADFTITNTAYSPQFWLRKTAATGDAGGYLVYYNAGTWYLGIHAAAAGSGDLGVLASVSSPVISTATWYTADIEVINDKSGNPVIKLYVYAQGGSRPAQPNLLYVDTAKTFSSGYFGLGANTTGLSYDNVVISRYDSTALKITSPSRAVSSTLSSPVTATRAITDEGGTFYIPYIQTGTTVSATATLGAGNLPVGGGVKFVLDQGLSGQQTSYSVGGSSPFSVSFSGVGKGSHTLNAYVVNASHVVQSGDLDSDQEAGIGVGDIISEIGDSITAGYPYFVGSPASPQNAAESASGGYAISADSRNFPQEDANGNGYAVGYSVELNDLLSSYYGYPVFLMNEGASSYRTGTLNDNSDAHSYNNLMRTTEWINRETSLAPSKWLVHLGVNDAVTGVSASQFKTNMQSIIDDLVNSYGTAGSNIYLAKPYFTQDDTDVSSQESSYTSKIDELISSNSLSAGPDFFSYFQPYGSSLYSNDYHPDTAGYSVMSKLWSMPLLSPLGVNISGSGGTATVSWNSLTANNPEINGYKVKYGTSPGVYTTTVDAGNVLTTNITGLSGGHTYYFVVSGYYSDPTSSTVTETANSSQVSLAVTSSISANTASILNHSTGNSITLTGTGTAWTPGTPGSPTFTLSGGTGASITAQTVSDGTHATLTIAAGSAIGTLTISDPSSGASTTVTVVGNTGDMITAFTFASPTATGAIDGVGHAIAITVPYGTDVTSLVPTIAISSSATVSPLSGNPENFATPVTYTVTAEDGVTTQAYTATVTISPPVSIPTIPAAPAPVQRTGGRAPLIEAPVSTAPVPSTPPVAASSPRFAGTKNLSIGMTDPEIKLLQEYLNAHGFILAKTGPGSPGNETQKFGTLTKTALIKFQDKYASEILFPIGLKKGTGIFGKASREAMNTNP